jgi:hypothetical protein
MGKTTERNPANQILLKLLKFNNKDKPKMQEPYGKTMKIKLESKPLEAFSSKKKSHYRHHSE